MLDFKLDRMEFFDTKIKPRQERIQDNLNICHGNCSVWTKTKSNKELSKGCQSCKNGTWLCLFVGHKCNLDCSYCSRGSKQVRNSQYDHPKCMQNLWIADIKMVLDTIENNIQGVSYSGGEPFMHLPKVLDMAAYVQENHPSIYQWMYTNGTLVNDDKLVRLKEVGISELRWHLGATNFSEAVLDKMKTAVDIIKFINVETPADLVAKEYLVDKEYLKRLEALGVYQINLPEIYLNNQHNQTNFSKEDLYLYSSIGYGPIVSPMYSRQVVYDVMDYAVQHNIDILINDCSNDAKNLQLTAKFSNQHYPATLLKREQITN